MLAACLPRPASSQDVSELRTLIFEPVAINTEQPAVTNDDGDGSLQVTELTTLPGNKGDSRPASYFLQSRDEPSMDELEEAQASISRYEEEIAELEVNGGPYEEELIQELTAMGDAYSLQGEYEQALRVYDRASHINRVNHGLFNLRQVPLVNKMIDAYLALGDLESADQQHEYLFYLHQRAHGPEDPALIPAMSRLAEWNLFAFKARIQPEPRQIATGKAEDYRSNISNSIGSENFRTQRLVNAQALYQTMVDIIEEHEGKDDPRLPEIEAELARINYYLAANYSIDGSSFQGSGGLGIQQFSAQNIYDYSLITSNSMGYRHGRDLLESRIDRLHQNPETRPPALAEAIIDLGDWLLLFKKRLSALDAYEEAYRILEESSETSPETWLHPRTPVQLPTFIAPRYSRADLDIPKDATLHYRGHIDVSFSLNRYGIPRDVQILGRSSNATEILEQRLVRYIRASQFRPRLEEGSPPDEDPIQLRYYYTW